MKINTNRKKITLIKFLKGTFDVSSADLPTDDADIFVRKSDSPVAKWSACHSFNFSFFKVCLSFHSIFHFVYQGFYDDLIIFA